MHWRKSSCFPYLHLVPNSGRNYIVQDKHSNQPDREVQLIPNSKIMPKSYQIHIGLHEKTSQTHPSHEHNNGQSKILYSMQYSITA